MESVVDKLTMLLSTDWFYGYWPLVGLNVASDERKLIQAECRSEVKRIIGDAPDYWQVSFEGARIAATREKLLGMFGRLSVDKSAAHVLAQMLDDPRGSLESSDTSLFSSLTEMLVGATGGSDPALEPGLLQRVARVWAESGGDDVDFQRISKESLTAWDRYVASLTPDLPTMLADFLAIDFVGRDRFGSFWSRLSGELKKDEKSALTDWYVSTARGLVDPAFEVPRWMM